MKEKVNPNLCEKCHAEHGCGESHLFLQADTGICGMCGQVSEVWDCALLSLYAEMGIEPDDVSRALPSLRYHPHEEPLKMPEVHTMATEFLKQKYSP